MVSKPKASDRTEWSIKQKVKRILEDNGWNYWMPAANAFGRSGQSDFLAVKLPRMFMAIETKYDDVPTQLQLNFLASIHAAGHYAFLVDETNVEELRTTLINDCMIVPGTSLLKWRENLTNNQ